MHRIVTTHRHYLHRNFAFRPAVRFALQAAAAAVLHPAVRLALQAVAAVVLHPAVRLALQAVAAVVLHPAVRSALQAAAAAVLRPAVRFVVAEYSDIFATYYCYCSLKISLPYKLPHYVFNYALACI